MEIYPEIMRKISHILLLKKSFPAYIVMSRVKVRKQISAEQFAGIDLGAKILPYIIKYRRSYDDGK